MKSVILFYLEDCPYCKRSMDDLKNIIEEFPQYRDIEIKMIEESKEPKLAQEYSYYYVPTFYIGKAKVKEGRLSKKDVIEVLEEASK